MFGKRLLQSFPHLLPCEKSAFFRYSFIKTQSTSDCHLPGTINLVSPEPWASAIDLLLTAPSPEPAGLLASRLAFACDSGELELLFAEEGDAALLEGVAGALGGLFAVWASMASLKRHFTSSA